MAARNQSSKRRAVAPNPQFPGGGIDRISGLADDMLGHILSFLPASDAVRSSALSSRWRRAWTHSPDLKISDELHQDRFIDFADKILAQYGATDIPSLNVAIGRQSNLGPATAVWLRKAMERVVGSISVQVDRYALNQLVLPRSLQATAMTLDLSAQPDLVKPLLIFPEFAEPAAFARLADLSLSNLKLQIDGFGEFLSSCFPELRKLRLHNVHNVVTRAGKEGLWPLVLHMDMLEELHVRVYQLMQLQVAAPKLRLLTVSHSFDCLSAVMATDTVVKISAPRLEAITWSGRFPKQMDFLTDPRCVRRLAGILVYWPSISTFGFSLPDVVQFLQTCSGADQLEVSVDISYANRPSMLMLARQDFMEHIPCLTNIRILSLTIITILRWLRCPIGPSVFSFLRRCPNLTLLHIDLSTLHQFSRLDRQYLVFPDDDADTEAAAEPRKAQNDQLQLSSLRKIRISGFVGRNPEMELADLLFGVGTARPALERISISSFAQLSGRMDRIALKMKARFPLAGGRWDTSPLKEVTWTKNMDGPEW